MSGQARTSAILLVALLSNGLPGEGTAHGGDAMAIGCIYMAPVVVGISAIGLGGNGARTLRVVYSMAAVTAVGAGIVGALRADSWKERGRTLAMGSLVGIALGGMAVANHQMQAQQWNGEAVFAVNLAALGLISFKVLDIIITGD